jgi:hypothetical protein
MSMIAGTDEYNPLSGVSVVGDQVIIDGGADVQIEGEGYERGRVEGAIRRLYSAERFNRHLCGVLGWVGRWKGIKSLAVEPSDTDFSAASEVVYRRLLDSGLGPVFDRLSDQALEDIIIIFAGFGPMAMAVADEIKERNKPVVTGNEVEEKDD